MPEIVVIGAGISGLTAAFQLAKAGKDVLLLESSGSAGGKIQTERIDGYLLESGPNSLRVDNRETLDLIAELGLTSRMIAASPNAKIRFILKNGNWIQVPTGPRGAIGTSLFSVAGKMRVLGEPLISKTKLADESVASFISRRFGKEIFEFAADPFITGIYAGDAAKLSMRHTFPFIWNAEQQYGSIIRGLLKGKKKRTDVKTKPTIISFPEGLSEVIVALRSALGDKIQFHQSALQVEKTVNGYAVTTPNRIEAKRIVFALPAHETASLLSMIAPDISSCFHSIEYAPVVVAYLGYRNDQFEHVPEGFGGLIPSREKRKILGIIFSSSNFSNRAPEGHVLLTVMIGGARNSDIVLQTDEEILQLASDELATLLKARGQPVFRHLKIWKSAIPQYHIGYGDILHTIDRTEQENPGLYFLGNYRGGISVGACMKNATELAKRLV